jgi:hypothetical protein
LVLQMFYKRQKRAIFDILDLPSRAQSLILLL